MPYEVGRALGIQGDLLMYRGLYDRANAVYQESLQMCKTYQVQALTLLSLGILAQRQGHLALARERLERALTLVQGKWLSLQSPILAALGHPRCVAAATAKQARERRPAGHPTGAA